MAYAETRTMVVAVYAKEAVTISTTVGIDIKVPAGTTSVASPTINGVGTNLAVTLDAGSFTATIKRSATTQAVAVGDVLAVECTQQKQYGLEASFGIEHTVTHP